MYVARESLSSPSAVIYSEAMAATGGAWSDHCLLIDSQGARATIAFAVTLLLCGRVCEDAQCVTNADFCSKC